MTQSSTTGRRRLDRIQRRSVTTDPARLIQDAVWGNQHTHVAVFSATVEVHLDQWIGANLSRVESAMARYGAILFRGFKVDSMDAFSMAAGAMVTSLAADNGEHNRSAVSDKVYTPVSYPADKKILWHNENSYNFEWPKRIFFSSQVTASEGGETPIADARALYRSLPSDLREPFERKGVMYVRGYGGGVGLHWKKVFGVESRADAEDYCRKHRMQWIWRDDDRLFTQAVRPAVIDHPDTGERCWITQAQHWHPRCLDKETRRSIEEIYSEDEFPRNCFYGDGAPIEDDVMDEICKNYERIEFSYPWQNRDLMAVDNILLAHARNPYRGERKLFVGMGDAITFQGAKIETSK